MDLHVKAFDELTPAQLYELLRAREAVFVVEQQCSYPEVDGKDYGAYHVWLEEDGEILAYLRVLDRGVSYPERSIGRVLTLRRGEGLGQKVMEEGLAAADEKFGPGPIRIEAQTYAQGFYERFGFRRVSDEFLEDGIPHVEMLRE